MFKKAIEKLTDVQLKKRNRLALGIGIAMLILMVIVLIISLMQISDGEAGVMLPILVPTVLGPLTMIPLLYSSALSAEIKRRKGN